jgi:hypothetical protein
MAAPNIVNVTSIYGITTAVGLTTTGITTFISNSAGSNQVLKINTILAANTDGTTNADITVRYHLNASPGVGNSTPIASTIVVPADASLVIIGKDNPIYLEENRSLTAQASSASKIAVICSYEQIS